MKVLIACEFSGIVRDAFLGRGHDAVSCDLLPTERPGPHLQCDVREVLGGGWDLMVAFPPCTHLSRSGAWRWWDTPEQAAALGFVQELMAAPVPRWALENPVGAINSKIRRPDMILQPWQYGHAETKATCLWLHRLPVLMAADVVSGPYGAATSNAANGPDRGRHRSRTLLGVAAAMADQWGEIERPAPNGLTRAPGAG